MIAIHWINLLTTGSRYVREGKGFDANSLTTLIILMFKIWLPSTVKLVTQILIHFHSDPTNPYPSISVIQQQQNKSL